MNFSLTKLSFLSLLRWLAPLIGTAVSLYPALAVSPEWFGYVILITLLLAVGAFKYDFRFFQLGTVVLVISFATAISEMDVEALFYGGLIGLAIYTILEFGYILQIVDRTKLYEDRDYVNVNKYLILPTIVRVVLVSTGTVLLSLIMIIIAPVLVDGIITPGVDLFLLVLVMVYALYGVYRGISMVRESDY